jgi:TonB family protein
MSAATAPALEKTPQRSFSRHPISVPVDLIVLRSGVPENLPGRCTDISEVGVGAIVAAEMVPGQLLAVELRLPNVGVPVRARAVVRYQIRLQCGLEFVGLSAEQRAMIRYWVHRSTTQRAAVPILVPKIFDEETGAARFEGPAVAAGPAAVEAAAAEAAAKPKRRIRIGRRGIYALMACVLGGAGLGSWQWQRSWNELEKRVPDGQEALRVSPEIMERRIVKKVDPVYPEAARAAGAEGMVVLDAVIAADGSVKRVQPVSGPELLVQSATEAVRSWRFEPYVDRSIADQSSGSQSSAERSSGDPSSGDRASGKAVEVETTIAVEFRLH